ncbi:MAG: hypothetical protein IK081_06445 [Lachnospiraceae bacterium]|nr:hypothetical protein [Lachnospiraceae bacterium]
MFLTRVLDELKETENIVQKELTPKPGKGKYNIIPVEFVFGILFVALLFSTREYNFFLLRYYWKWITVGIGVLIVDVFMIKVWERKECLNGFHLLYVITVITNFPIFVGFNFFAWTVSKYEIERDSIFSPYIILAADLAAISALPLADGIIKALALWILKILSAENLMADVRTLFFLLYILIIKMIFVIINFIAFALISVKNGLDIQQERRAALEDATKSEESLDMNQVNGVIEVKKSKINNIYSHAGDYIRAVVMKFQLAVLILAYFIAAVFPATIGIKAYDDTQTAFLNAVTIITLIMLFLDKARDWDKRIEQQRDKRKKEPEKESKETPIT